MDISARLVKYIHPLDKVEREKVIEEISAASFASFDFYLLVVLSCSIATMGLVTNSPAVIIGAMLVAPLMSPIIGLGLASITGKARLAEDALSALLRGAALAVILSALMTLVNRNLPFVVLQDLPSEVLARTHPSPIDLVIALAGGLAAAYAMTRPNISAALPGVAIATALMPPLCTIGVGVALERWDVAGGAALLFLANAVTIAFAAALVFFLRGFAPRRENEQASRALMISAALLLLLLIPLSFYSIKFFNEASENRNINEVVNAKISEMSGAELLELKVERGQNELNMVLTVRTASLLRYEQVVALQKAIATELQQQVSLKVNQVFAERLDPLIPPTFTLTPTPTLTNTPGPSPTLTPTPTFIPTFTPTATFTPTPISAQVVNTLLPKLNLYQSPGGPVIGQIRAGQVLTRLYEKQEVNGIIWVQIMDAEGRIGWIPELYLKQITQTPNP
ncbi:MAG: hypothetical protein Fur002_15420 [Anaerolineales bacterium]